MKLSDYVIMTDIDGTLITYDGQMPQRNVDAILRFTKAGGRFGFATGRTIRLTRPYVEQLPVNMPCALYNGSALYDFERDDLWYELNLQEDHLQHIHTIAEALPDVGVIITTRDSYYTVKKEEWMTDFLKIRGTQQDVQVDWDRVPGPWFKTLFVLPDNTYEAFFRFVESHDLPGVRFVASNSRFVEMLPAASSKRYALERLVEAGSVRREQLVTIGDYFNDLEMIRYAAIGATLETAPDEIRNAADLVVGKCEDGVVADVIEYLEAKCGG